MNEIALAIAGSATGVTFVSKIADAVGWYAAPYQVTRLAKAEALAERIRVESEIDTADLIRRAAIRSVMEEITHQENLEIVVERALERLSDYASPQNMSDNWVAHTLSKCRTVSDDKMRDLWASILAGEANVPGTFSRRTINLIDDLEESDAEMFMNFCRFTIVIEGEVHPMIHDVTQPIYTNCGINGEAILQLKGLGLIDRPGTTFAAELGPFSSELSVQYMDESRKLLLPHENGNSLMMGRSMFTPAGKELMTICDPIPVEGFFNYLTDQIWNKNWVPV